MGMGMWMWNSYIASTYVYLYVSLNLNIIDTDMIKLCDRIEHLPNNFQHCILYAIQRQPLFHLQWKLICTKRILPSISKRFHIEFQFLTHRIDLLLMTEQLLIVFDRLSAFAISHEISLLKLGSRLEENSEKSIL